ncbi:condensation domain-containing protein [Streptomyces sp. SCSIO 30461]|uniref:condensation domain-containing protein n=1 Tax=Streptomyces sp. SCSIO 30461 TaxID=3118085 RepID=UPI0030CD52D8
MSTDTPDAAGQIARQEELLRRARARASGRGTTTPATGAAGTGGEAAATAQQGPVPLSHAQRRMWLMDRLGHAGASYSVPFATRLRGPLDAGALAGALTSLVRRHEILRTRYGQRDGEPHQEVLDAPTAIAVPVRDCAETDAPALLADEARRVFDLSTGTVLRALVLRHGEQDHTVLLTFHHIAIDGGSLDTVARELADLYAAAVGGGEPAVGPQPPQYADFARGEHAAAARTEQGLAHWTERLSGAKAPRLPRPRTSGAGPRRSGTHTAPIDGRLPEALRGLGGEHRATLFTVALTAAFAALRGLTGDDDLVIGIAGTHRRGAAMRDLVGLCVNTLPVRVDTSGDPEFTELLARVREALLEAQQYRDVPFDLVLERLGAAARDADGTALVRVTSDVIGEPAILRLPDTVGEYVDVETGEAKFDLSFGLVTYGQPAALVQYAGTALDDTTAADLCARYAALLAAVTTEPSLRLSQLPGGTPARTTGTATVAPPGKPADAAVGNGADRGAGEPARDTHPAEVLLRAHPRVADAHVAEAPGGALLAYAVLCDSVGPTPHDLRARLRTTLPPESLPASVTLLDAMPRTSEGAVDQSRLPGMPAAASGPAAPRGPRAEAVVEGFTALLGRTPEPDDDFFALGGHSLVAVKLAERLRSALKLPLTGLDILQARTPRALTALLDSREGERTAAAKAQAVPGAVFGQPRPSRPGTVLVTGGTGGVGAYVLRELAAQGRPVLALARPESAHLVAGDGVEVIEGDLADPSALRAAVAAADAVIHAACTFTRPEVDLAAMEAMVDGWRRGPFVFVSSVDAYGHPAGDRVAEESAPGEPLSPYGRGKLDCEALLLRAAGTEGRGGASAVRSPIVWGAHDRLRDQLRWGATGLLYQAAAEGRPIALPKPGTGGHDWYGVAWVHAAALARAVTACLDAPVHGVANAVSGHVSWHELATDLTGLLGSASVVTETVEVHQDLDHRWHYDSRRLARPLRAEPGEDRRAVLAAMIDGGTASAR